MKIHDLTTVFSPFLHILGTDESKACDLMWSLNTASHSGGVVCRILRGKKMKSLIGLYDECGAALQFPYYFGENLAALDECLADLEWLPATAYILSVFDAPLFLSSESEGVLVNVLQTLQDVQETWNMKHSPSSTGESSGIPFHVIFQCPPEAIESVLQRFHQSLPGTVIDILDR